MSLSTWGPHRGRPWTSGRWSAELRDDELADLRVDGVPVARSVRAVVRDRDWGTVPVTVTAVAHEHGAVVLGLRYDGLGITADATLRIANEDDFRSLEQVGEMAWKTHNQPDAGLWELRTRTAVHTYSSVMSWAACDRLANAADYLGLPDRAALWRERANTVRANIDAGAWHAVEGHYAGGHFAASFGGSQLDASLLQMVELRYLEPGDPRFRSTLAAVQKALRRGEHMLRYDSEDDFGLPETAFNICTFWLIEALHRSGQDEEARRLFEAMLGHRTRSGLLSEDMDFETSELWGNFPQTYSLVGIINCAGQLSRSWRDWR